MIYVLSFFLGSFLVLAIYTIKIQSDILIYLKSSHKELLKMEDLLQSWYYK